MRDTPSCRWQQWRVKLIEPAAAPSVPFTRAALFEPVKPEGIRHDLVARVRREIADGTYDTEEKWLLAEERLFHHIAK